MKYLGYFFSNKDPSRTHRNLIPVFRGPYRTMNQAKKGAREYFQKQFQSGSFEFWICNVNEDTAVARALNIFKHEYYNNCFFVNFIEKDKKDDFYKLLEKYFHKKKTWFNEYIYDDISKSRCTIKSENHVIDPMVLQYIKNSGNREKDILETFKCDRDFVIMPAQLVNTDEVLKHIVITKKRLDFAEGEMLCEPEPVIEAIAKEPNSNMKYCKKCFEYFGNSLIERLYE